MTVKKAWTIEAFMRNWLGKNEVLTEMRSHRKTATAKLESEIEKQERKVKNIDKQIAKLTADKVKIQSLISDLKSEKDAVSKG